MDEARSRLAACLGVDMDELSFGPSTTQNVYVLAQAFREWLSPGDAVVVTDQDHEANSGPWRRLADAGIEVREWRIDPESGHLDPQRLAALLDGSVKLVCFPHCSNLLAEINPVREIVDLAHAAGAITCVDGVSFAPHGLPDVGALGADIYLFSSYKTYGPHQGIMTIRRSLGEALPNQGHYFNADSLYKRFTPAGPDHAQIAACAGMVDYYQALHAHHFADADAQGLTPTQRCAAVNRLMAGQEQSLLAPLLDYLEGRRDLRLLGPADPTRRAPTVSVMASRPAQQVVEALAAHGILAAYGSFYAVRPMTAMGLDADHGAVRLSLVHYNTRDELDQLLEALDNAL
jgi:selenocysteine lyase/cysteine desulfurase